MSPTPPRPNPNFSPLARTAPFSETAILVARSPTIAREQRRRGGGRELESHRRADMMARKTTDDVTTGTRGRTVVGLFTDRSNAESAIHASMTVRSNSSTPAALWIWCYHRAT